MRLPIPPLPGTAIDPRFPDEDGRPMGDTDFHSEALILLRQALQDFLTGAAGWYVASNLILYWDYNNPMNRRDPDVLVARGVGSHRRRSFRVWEEGTLTCVLFEVASRKTWRQDVGERRKLYAQIGVPEYFLFDPEARYLNPPLQGFRLRKGVYARIRPAADGSLTSKQLGLRLVVEGPMLRLADLKTGKAVLTRAEQAERAERERERERERAKRERKRAERERERADELVHGGRNL
jgi:Uma2 family endonuclease